MEIVDQEDDDEVEEWVNPLSPLTYLVGSILYGLGSIIYPIASIIILIAKYTGAFKHASTWLI